MGCRPGRDRIHDHPHAVLRLDGLEIDPLFAKFSEHRRGADGDTLPNHHDSQSWDRRDFRLATRINAAAIVQGRRAKTIDLVR